MSFRPILTDSAISSRSARAAGLGLTLGLSVLVGGCFGSRQSLVGAPMASPPTTDRLRLPAGGAAPPGLAPLPTPRQVVNAVPLGRRDPFAPLPLPAPAAGAAAAGTPAAGGAGSGTAGTGRPVGTPGTAGAAAAGSAGSTASSGIAALPPLPRLPASFRFSGVIRSGGRTEAVVQFGDLSGSLRRGDRGGVSTELLPKGWRVESVDADRGQLRLRHAGQLLTVEM